MNNYKINGIVIKKRNYSEADKILTLFTDRHGKLSVIAKGVRNVTSKRGPSIEMFTHTAFSLHKSKFLDIVTETKVIDAFEGIRKNLRRIKYAYQLCEAVDLLTRECQKQDNIYCLLLSNLKKLDNETLSSTENFKRMLLTTTGFLSETREVDGNLDDLIEQVAEKNLTTKNLYV